MPAYAVINPIEADAGFPFAGLCGTGVAFYLAMGVRMRLREQGGPLPDLRRYLDLVALGTIADLVPVVEENRVLVKYGLRELGTSLHPGIAALKRVSGVTQLSTGAVGFRLAPRLNAGGRLDDAMRSVTLLTTGDVGPRRTPGGRARRGEPRPANDRARDARRGDHAQSTAAAGSAAGTASSSRRPSFIPASSASSPRAWSSATTGRRCSSPPKRAGWGAAPVAASPGSTSTRRLAACRDCLERFGGHRMAAGLSIKLDRVAEFAERLEAEVAARTQPDDFVPQVAIDAELSLRAIDASCFADLDRLEPYGMGNPEPVFLTRAVRVRDRRIVGETHLKLLLEHDGRCLPAIGFGMADASVAAGDRLDVLFSADAQRVGWQRIHGVAAPRPAPSRA